MLVNVSYFGRLCASYFGRSGSCVTVVPALQWSDSSAGRTPSSSRPDAVCAVVESPFAALRLRTDAAKRFKRVDRAIAVIWKMLLVAESRFRRLKAPELMRDVYLGAVYKDGIVVEPTPEKVAA